MHLCVVCMIYVCACLHMCGCIWMHVEARRLLQLLSTSFSMAGSLLNPKLNDSARLASLLATGRQSLPLPLKS